MVQLSGEQKERIRMFLMTISLEGNISELLVPIIVAHPPVRGLFSKDELMDMWPQFEEARGSSTRLSLDEPMTGRVSFYLYSLPYYRNDCGHYLL